MPIGVGAALLGSAAISGGFSLGSSIISSMGAKSGAKKLAKAIKKAVDWQKTMYRKGEGYLAPYREVGPEFLDTLATMVREGPGEFTEDPGYQFRLSEGIKARERAAAARGDQLSGEQLKSLERYGQDYASNEYQNFLNRYYQSLVPYAGLAEVGQSAAAQTASLGQATGAGIANTLASLAPYQAQFAEGQYTPFAQGLGFTGQNLMDALSIYRNQGPPGNTGNALKRLYTPGMGYARTGGYR